MALSLTFDLLWITTSYNITEEVLQFTHKVITLKSVYFVVIKKSLLNKSLEIVTDSWFLMGFNVACNGNLMDLMVPNGP